MKHFLKKWLYITLLTAYVLPHPTCAITRLGKSCQILPPDIVYFFSYEFLDSWFFALLLFLFAALLVVKKFGDNSQKAAVIQKVIIGIPLSILSIFIIERSHNFFELIIVITISFLTLTSYITLVRKFDPDSRYPFLLFLPIWLFFMLLLFYPYYLSDQLFPSAIE